MKGILLGLLFATGAYANIEKAPKNFQIKNKKAVYVDFTQVESNITYHLSTKTVTAETIIEFNSEEAGAPLFDLNAKLSSASLNGKSVNVVEVNDPTNVTTYRMVDTVIAPGTHRLTILSSYDENVDFSRDYVSSAFWMSDLSDRKYLEKYLPTNLEFDQYAMKMNVKVFGLNKVSEHEVFTNGALTVNAVNDFTIQFPEYFTTSSYYFHITKKDRFSKRAFNYKSITGKEFPVMIYSKSSWNLGSAERKTLEVLKELEVKLGAWSHPSLTIYVAGAGGMEHSGATITSLSALQHEICHSYFARGVMPIDGNSGWMDEAIASWRDAGYRSVSSPNFSSTSMSGHSTYRRYTDRKAYNQGANFMAFLNNRLASQGGLIKFLSHLYKTYSHQNISTQIFKKELELYSGENFTAEFNQYIFGSKLKSAHDHKSVEENPYHPKLTAKQLRDLL